MYENPFAGDDEEETEMEIGTESTGMDVVDSVTPIGKGSGTGQISGSKIDRGDSYVLHFYDLAARKPHSLYQFIKS